MVGHGSKIGRKQEQAIAALLSNRSIEEAAHTAGIGGTTLLRWIQEPQFNKAYRKARRAYLRVCGRRITVKICCCM
jgi:hypothetical protein